MSLLPDGNLNFTITLTELCLLVVDSAEVQCSSLMSVKVNVATFPPVAETEVPTGLESVFRWFLPSVVGYTAEKLAKKFNSI